MSFIIKKPLERRTFIKGMGATMALPFLDAMVPALSAMTLRSTPRLGFIYIANGVIQDKWIPETTGANFELSPTLKPLEPVKSYVNVLSGLSHLAADTRGDGTGDHPRSSAVWLSLSLACASPSAPGVSGAAPAICSAALGAWGACSGSAGGSVAVLLNARCAQTRNTMALK